jgi:cytidylate kinase
VAFPNADYKFYIDCDINIRAERRFKDLKNVPLEEVKKQIEERDRLDKTREHSPLVKVADAIEIDASKTPEEIVAKMLSFIL